MVIRSLLLFLLLALPAQAQDSLRLILPETRPVAGEMIPLTIRGEYTGAIALESMVFPDSKSYDWIQYAPDKWGEERIDGKSRKIFERRIAIFARASGGLSIGPVTHHLSKASGATREEIEVVAAPVTISVAPYPGQGRPLAVPALIVTDELSADPAMLKEGETFVRRLTLSAEGTMAHFLPQRPAFDEPWLISFAAPEIRETRLTVRGPVAVVVWEWNLRPRSGETGTISPIHFPYFNTIARKMWSAVTLPLEVGGTASTGGTTSPQPGTTIRSLLILSGGIVLGMALLLFGRTPAASQFPGALLRRLRPNPHRGALLAAARQDDFAALRRAASAYTDYERTSGRAVNDAALADLDRAMFATVKPGGRLDPQAFVRALTG